MSDFLQALFTLWLIFQFIGIFLGVIVGILAVIYVLYRTFLRPIK